MEDSTIAADPAPTPYVAPTEEKKAFLAALAKAQGAFEPIVRARTVEIRPKDSAAYRFAYAELGEILAKTRPACSANGLSLRSRVLPNGENVWIESVLAHSEGYEDVSAMSVMVGTDIKQFGGRITYLRRYMGAAQLGIASEDDLDEDGVGTGEITYERRPPAAPAPRAKPQPAARPAAAPKQAAAPAQGEAAITADRALLPEEKAAMQAAGAAITHGAPAEPTGEVIGESQAKWVIGKLTAYFTPPEATQWLLQRNLPDNAKLIPAARFDEVRSALLALS